jgi:hypothetical protein
LTAYLALHRHELVTGERLRGRVLGRPSGDASARTLSNVASAVRRSLGTTDGVARLGPVSSAGLYGLVDVDTDVELFHELIDDARHDEGGAIEKLCAALELVRGEPLGAILKGFEWFLAEGHLGRILHNGDVAVRLLCEHARSAGDHDLEFWALDAGRRLDPYNDNYAHALARVGTSRQL